LKLQVYMHNSLASVFIRQPTVLSPVVIYTCTCNKNTLLQLPVVYEHC
jgi:hypothetical protein